MTLRKKGKSMSPRYRFQKMLAAFRKADQVEAKKLTPPETGHVNWVSPEPVMVPRIPPQELLRQYQSGMVSVNEVRDQLGMPTFNPITGGGSIGSGSIGGNAALPMERLSLLGLAGDASWPPQPPLPDDVEFFNGLIASAFTVPKNQLGSQPKPASKPAEILELEPKRKICLEDPPC